MELKIFSLYDSKAQYYTPPVMFHGSGQAIRAIIDQANDPTSQVGRYPEDFHLYQVGSFDDQRGLVVGGEPIAFGPVASFVRTTKPNGN